MYDKGDHEGAMKEYLRTIGSVRGSYVVRKFLTANLTPLLTIYLQELHAHGLANAEHTTLLLNTYAKVGDVAKVDAFVRSEGRVVGPVGVSQRRQEKERAENRHLTSIPPSARNQTSPVTVARFFTTFQTKQLSSSSTFVLLLDLPPVSSSVSPNNAQIQTAVAPSYLSYLVLSRAPAVPPALSGGEGAGKKPDTQDKGEDLATALAAAPGTHPSVPQTPSAGATSQSQHLPGTHTPPARPTPTLFFAHFVDHLGCFMTFLETRPGKAEKRDQAAVWNTLLELYLTDGTADADAKRAIPYDQHKAIRLLHATHIPYDLMHALVLCSSHKYTPGLVLLWEKSGMYEDVLRFWMERHNSGIGASDSGAPTEPTPSTQVVSAIQKYGPTKPTLYPLVLRFLTSTPALLTMHQSDLEELLEHVESEKIVSPLSVVQVLSRNGVASVGLVKGWLMRKIKEGKEEVPTDQQLISSYRLETKTKLKQVGDL
ncbi:hypothetical protein PAXINDRAFT_99818 [Paxillus involutus ATCC 200175]|uniref:Uncharacterized protein n=1 Tax=Paxillus involutus ATCC 200175 TaxID=664439 RepID=A0A0C9TWW2_PAXIN|nr:hypothetical protein PAXINDRAFT_99818 [Paxillus involutus ATCC 200175]